MQLDRKVIKCAFTNVEFLEVILVQQAFAAADWLSTKFIGYIHFCANLPFMMHFYTEEQIKMCVRLAMANDPRILNQAYFDATGFWIFGKKTRGC